jgi:hypothetical protein
VIGRHRAAPLTAAAAKASAGALEHLPVAVVPGVPARPRSGACRWRPSRWRSWWGRRARVPAGS